MPGLVYRYSYVALIAVLIALIITVGIEISAPTVCANQ